MTELEKELTQRLEKIRINACYRLVTEPSFELIEVVKDVNEFCKQNRKSYSV